MMRSNEMYHKCTLIDSHCLTFGDESKLDLQLVNK